MPTSASASRSALRSISSCAMRESVRSTAPRRRAGSWPLAAGVLRRHRCSFPASLCRFKGVADECRRWLRRRPQPDQAAVPTATSRSSRDDDPLGQLALGPRRSLRDLVRGEQVEGRDVSAADARQRLVAAELARPRVSRRHLELRETRPPRARARISSGVGNRASSMVADRREERLQPVGRRSGPGGTC